VISGVLFAISFMAIRNRKPTILFQKFEVIARNFEIKKKVFVCYVFHAFTAKCTIQLQNIFGYFNFFAADDVIAYHCVQT